MDSYCTKCRTKTKSSQISKAITAKNGRQYVKMKCSKCGSNKTRFISGKSKSAKVGGSLLGSIAGATLGSVAGPWGSLAGSAFGDSLF